MFYQNVGTPVRSSAAYVAGFGLILLVIGMGYSAYHYRQATAPLVPERATRSEPIVAQVAPQERRRAVDDCTLARPCEGTAARVLIPVGHVVCFDPPIWENLPKLGFKTSTQGGQLTKYECTAEQALAGTCKAGRPDSFQFTPEADTTPPRHWFTQNEQCLG